MLDIKKGPWKEGSRLLEYKGVRGSEYKVRTAQNGLRYLARIGTNSSPHFHYSYEAAKWFREQVDAMEVGS